MHAGVWRRFPPLVLPFKHKPPLPPIGVVQLAHHVGDRGGLLALNFCRRVSIEGINAVLAHKAKLPGCLLRKGAQVAPKAARAVVIAACGETGPVNVEAPAVETVAQGRVGTVRESTRVAINRHNGTRRVLLLDHPAPFRQCGCRACGIDAPLRVQLVVIPLVSNVPPAAGIRVRVRERLRVRTEFKHQKPGRRFEGLNNAAQRCIITLVGKFVVVGGPRDRVDSLFVHAVNDAGRVPKIV
eukprot:scaffold112071_cov48-Phaeocystis_antarctica.AAC.1